MNDWFRHVVARLFLIKSVHQTTGGNRISPSFVTSCHEFPARLFAHKQGRPSELQGCEEKFPMKSTFADWSYFSAKLLCCAENQSTADRQPEQVKRSMLCFGFSQFRVDVPSSGRKPRRLLRSLTSTQVLLHLHDYFIRLGSLKLLHASSSLVSTLLQLILPKVLGPRQNSCQLPGAQRPQLHQGWHLTSMHSRRWTRLKFVRLTKTLSKNDPFKITLRVESRWPLAIHIISNHFSTQRHRSLCIVLFGFNILSVHLIYLIGFFLRCSFPGSLFMFCRPSAARSSRQRTGFNPVESMQQTCIHCQRTSTDCDWYSPIWLYADWPSIRWATKQQRKKLFFAVQMETSVLTFRGPWFNLSDGVEHAT